MTYVVRPASEKDVVEAVQQALRERKALELVGHGTKRALGRPAQADTTLDLSGLSGVTLYEPEELVLSARAGTPIADIEAVVAAHKQQLAFEPMDYGPLLGGVANCGTIGGVLAANLCGPRRIKAGAARDHFLGFSAVSGRGEVFKSGGRVVKNVTGYDLCKLMAGSWGTLAALTTVTLKVLPRPETQATLLVVGLDDATAVRAMTVAMATACDVSGAAHLPAATARRISVGESLAAGRAVTALRLEGVAPSVAHRKAELTAAMKPLGEIAFADELPSRNLWRAICDVTPFAATPETVERPVWRISAVPSKGADVARSIAAECQAEALYDWAGGLVWIMLMAQLGDAGTGLVRRAAAACGGQAMLVRAPAAVRAAVPVFEPQAEALAGLTRRVKQSFDPEGVLNPGRMWAGQ
jgi:glycolate dehydrogenase FAD-binding subunit